MTKQLASQSRGNLLPQHEALIEASGISPEVTQARGYRSIEQKAELRRLGFGDQQCRVPALLIPVRGVSGEIVNYQIRPDLPRVGKNGKAVKYETPRETKMCLDVPPVVRQWIGDPSRPLVITEGVRKADSAASRGLCCIALLGVWNWRGTNRQGGGTALADWESIALKGRQTYICFDSDVMLKPAVHGAMARLKAFLEQRGAQVALIYLPPGEAGAKVGLDDFLVAGHTVADLLALASPDLCPVAVETERASEYQITEAGIVWQRETQQGLSETVLCNFSAIISTEIFLDDGVEPSRHYEIATCLKGREECCSIPAAQFAGMNWVTEKIGAEAIIAPGSSIRDRCRHAIQVLSGQVERKRVYVHSGWRKTDDEWVYLHNGGAIGATGTKPGIEVRLREELSPFVLPEPPEGEELAVAVRTSLKLLNLTPGHDEIVFPLFASIFAPVTLQVDFGLQLVGPTGEGKTELAAQAQQHYGAGFNSRRLPGSWLSTGNALEDLAFVAKDALLVIDDLAPVGSAQDVSRLHRDANRIFRAQGNRQGRGRMRSDGSIRAQRPPRGLLLSTGEDVVRGQSGQARTLIIELSHGDLCWSLLTQLQRRAAEGVYTQTMAGYVRYLAPRYEQIQANSRAEIVRLREAATQSGQHRRSPEIIAQLFYALQNFLAFAADCQAISSAQRTQLEERAWAALGQAAAKQVAHQQASDPVLLFLESLQAAIIRGEAFLAGMDGETPIDNPAAWGWRRAGTGENLRQDWQPRGGCIGWIDGDNLYLDSAASFAAAQKLASTGGETIPISRYTLARQLQKRNLLRSVEPGNLQVRREILGKRRRVLHLHIDALSSDKPVPSVQRDQPRPPSDPNGGAVAEDPDESKDGIGDGLAPSEARPVPKPVPHSVPESFVSGELPEGEVCSDGMDGFPAQRSPAVEGVNEHTTIEAPPDAEASSDVEAPPARPCSACGDINWWLTPQGNPICDTCHPRPRAPRGEGGHHMVLQQSWPAGEESGRRD